MTTIGNFEWDPMITDASPSELTHCDRLCTNSQNNSGARLANSSCTQAIITVVLAINDKHSLHVKHANNRLNKFVVTLP
jgi:hypothetical protein